MVYKTLSWCKKSNNKKIYYIISSIAVSPSKIAAWFDDLIKSLMPSKNPAYSNYNKNLAYLFLKKGSVFV
jgi:hypothetical protein